MAPDSGERSASAFRLPVLLAFVAASVVAGVWLASSVVERDAARGDRPLRADCRQFPGVCEPEPTGVAASALAAEQSRSDSAWSGFRDWEQRARDRGLWWPRADDSLARLDATLRGAITDARVLLHEARDGGAGEPSPDTLSGFGIAAAEAALARAIDARTRFARVASADLADREREPASAPGEGVSGPNVTLGAPMPADGRLDVTLLSGAIRVVGWDRDSVHLRGRMSPGERMVRVSVEADGAQVSRSTRDSAVLDSAANPRSGMEDGDVPTAGRSADVILQVDGLPRGLAAASELELYLPHGADVVLRAVNGSFVVEAFDGALEIATRTGNVLVSPTAAGTVPRRLELRSLTGSLTVPAATGRTRLHTGTGRVVVGDTLAAASRPGAVVVAESGRGAVHVAVRDAASVTARSVLGDVAFTGSVRGGADLVSHAGSATARLAGGAPRTVRCTRASFPADCEPSRTPVGSGGRGDTLVRVTSVRGETAITGAAGPGAARPPAEPATAPPAS